MVHDIDIIRAMRLQIVCLDVENEPRGHPESIYNPIMKFSSGMLPIYRFHTDSFKFPG